MSTVIWSENTFDYTIATSNKSVIDANYVRLAFPKACEANSGLIRSCSLECYPRQTKSWAVQYGGEYRAHSRSELTFACGLCIEVKADRVHPRNHLQLNNFTMMESQQYHPLIQANFSQVLPIAVCNNNTNPYVEADYTYPVSCIPLSSRGKFDSRFTFFHRILNNGPQVLDQSISLQPTLQR